MKIVSKFWQNFKTQPDIWFFYGFLLTFTLSIKKVLFFYPINGQFNEYSGIYLYLSDIFLILTLILWITSILCNKYDYLSICRRLFNALNKPLIFIPLLFVLWSFVSIIWSQNLNVALFRSFKLLELYLLYIYLIFKIPSLGKKELVGAFKIIILLGFIQSSIGIIQFIFQHSIGIFWLKESLISSDLPGVAKIILNGNKFIRSYGLFPHPNILGGFLVFSILISILYKRMFHACQKKECSTPALLNVPRGTFLSKWNINKSELLTLFIFIQIIGLILTFSKSAILGFILALTFIYFKRKANVSHQNTNKCSTWNIYSEINYFFRSKILIKQAIIVSLIIILAFFLIKPDIYSFFIKSLSERYSYLNVSRGTILANPIIGLGVGQFVLEMQKYSRIPLEIWQFQPVHNVFLLIWAELGIIGLSFFIYFIWKLLTTCSMKCSTPAPQNVPRGTFLSDHSSSLIKDLSSTGNYLENNKLNDMRIYFQAIIISFIFIMFFDHYLWDIQQGQLMLWFILGLLAYCKVSLPKRKL